MKTELSIHGEKFYINGKPVYSEINGCGEKMHGLLMNARFIQGVFDDKADPERFNRFGRILDPDKNTDGLIAALPEWYKYGLRAFTVGVQGGGTNFTIDNGTVDNNPYSSDGLTVDEVRLGRLKKLLDAADSLGMVVIVSLIYVGQIRFLDGATGIINAVRTMSRWLKDGGWKNVIIEPVNEYSIGGFKNYPLVNTDQGMVALMDVARRESGLPVGCSGGGGYLGKEVAVASDVILIHGNGQSRQAMMNLIRKAREAAPGKPIVCNEDSQAIGNMLVCMDNGVSWGYYNNLSKQEVPANWNVLDGEDKFMASRMAERLGICSLDGKNELKLVGISQNECYRGKCWPRVASLYPERIDYVEYYLDGEKIYTTYAEPFSLFYVSNWRQTALERGSGELTVKVKMADGSEQILHGEIGK